MGRWHLRRNSTADAASTLASRRKHQPVKKLTAVEIDGRPKLTAVTNSGLSKTNGRQNMSKLMARQKLTIVKTNGPSKTDGRQNDGPSKTDGRQN